VPAAIGVPALLLGVPPVPDDVVAELEVVVLELEVVVLPPEVVVLPPDAVVGVSSLLLPQAASSPARTPADPPTANPRSTVRRLYLPLRCAAGRRSSLIILPPPNDAVGHTPHTDHA
jgi:hypothetical protein